ncbi:MAG: creatininase family protein [Anaerolineae bacterium]|nr:creatininase family protein [Anaerolineae bacterium]
MKFGDLTFEEIKSCAENGWKVIIPTGCTEQQGPHLPVDFDTWFITQLSLAASEYADREYGIKTLVLPVIPFGPTPEHRGFGSGYIHLPQSIHESVINALLVSLEEQGFQRLIIWCGCGQHDLDEVINQFNESLGGYEKAIQLTLSYFDIWRAISDPSIPGGHADSFSTSIAMYLRPDSVRNERVFNPESKPVDWDNPDLDFSLYSSSGVIGDPTYASAELGKELWKQLIQESAAIIKQITKE